MSLDDVFGVIGAQGIELEVPIKMAALPDGKYTLISAAFTIPEILAITDVDFNLKNIVGNCSYEYTNNLLTLSVSGNAVMFSNDSSDLFATIKLHVANFVPSNQVVEISADYVKVTGGNIQYGTDNAVANIELKLLDTGAVTKMPGYSNPLMTHKLGADPFAVVFEDRVYIYMSSDGYAYDDGNLIDNNFSMLNRVVVISSDDMVNWTDHGEVPVAGVNNMNDGQGIAKWAWGSWAPAAAHKKINGEDKFFLYFSNSAGGIGVLAADSPIGPWTDPRGEALITHDTPGVAGVVWLFDPAVLVDDDGKAYLYFGGGIPGGKNTTQEQIANPRTTRIIQLGDDMISTVGEAILLDTPYGFENSGIHKYNDKYYYSYCTNFGKRPEGEESPPPGEIAYMTSDKPMGPFTYQTTILKNPYNFFGVGGNNHHAIFEFKNQWYIVYHAQTVSKEVLGDGRGYRSPHIDKVEFYDDGLIKEIIGTREGIAQLKNLDPYKRTEAETIAWNKGIETEQCDSPGGCVESINLNVTDIDDGDWLAVANADFGEKGATRFKANVASTVGGKIEIRLDNPLGKVIGTLDISPTGGEQEWEVIECDVEKTTGVHNLFFMFVGTEAVKENLFNFDYWQFVE